jgi:hypothetical protein
MAAPEDIIYKYIYYNMESPLSILLPEKNALRT